MGSLLPVFRRSLSDSWRGLLGWGLGIAAALFMYLPLFPSIGGNGDMQRIIDSMPPELVKALGYDQIASGPGYTQGTFYGLIGFLLLVIAATSWGSSAIAGAEETGRLELTLAHAVGRGQYVAEMALSVLLRLALLGLLAGTIVRMLDAPAELGIEAGHVAAATASLIGLALLSAATAFLLGAITGRRILATVAGAGIAVLGYVVNAIANQLADADWLYAISPYAWAYRAAPLSAGADWGGLALLYGLSALLAISSGFVLRRRNITG